MTTPLRNTAAFLCVWASWSLLDRTLFLSPYVLAFDPSSHTSPNRPHRVRRYPEMIALATAALLLLPWRFLHTLFCVRARARIARLPAGLEDIAVDMSI